MCRTSVVFVSDLFGIFGTLHWWQRLKSPRVTGMEKYDDGEVNFGPLIDLYAEEMRPTATDTVLAKSPEPVAASTPAGQTSDATVDQVLKAISALSVGMDKQNSVLGNQLSVLSEHLDALESTQRDRHVPLGTSRRATSPGVPDLFAEPEDAGFRALPAPLSASQYRQPSQQQEKPRVRPSAYNGSSSWEDYKAQFELVSDINRWDRRAKAAYLAVSLSGPAQAVLGDLDKTQRTSYSDLVAALDSRFGTSNRTEMFRVSLRSRSRQPAETLPELAQAIRRLTRQAYPDAPISLRESIAKDQFIEAMGDPELRWKVHQAKPGTLTEALDAAVEVEAFFSAEKQHGGATKIVQALNSQTPQPVDSALRQEVNELKTMVQQLVQQPRGGSDNSQRSWRRTWTSPECWACGDKGHIQRYCPKRPGDRLPMPSGRSTFQQPQERPGNETLSSSRAGTRQTTHH